MFWNIFLTDYAIIKQTHKKKNKKTYEGKYFFFKKKPYFSVHVIFYFVKKSCFL